MGLSSLKHAIVKVATLPPFPILLERLLRNGPTILTLHRFDDRDLGVLGHPVATLRSDLALVRRLGFEVRPIHDFVAAWASRSLPERTVSFTVDDGYRDFITHGAPVFAEFDCPVTVFAVTDFVDGRSWLWWDQLEFAFSHSLLTSLTLDIGGGRCEFAWRSPHERHAAWFSLVSLLKRCETAILRQAVTDAAASLEVSLPPSPPSSYAPMSWEECNALSSRGVSIGPHSATHPILARCTADESRREIRESWQRVRQIAAAPVPIFCYPNGDTTAFGLREQQFVSEEALIGALSTIERPLAKPRTREDQRQFAIPRWRYPDDSHQLVQLLLGLETLKRRVRHALARDLDPPAAAPGP
jgi:peptidoglycan/xylan/chitin deacetylase (PgdA/CDA1 family)